MIEFEKDEHVLYEVRRHWLVFFTEVVILIILSILPLAIMIFIKSSSNNLNLDFIAGNVNGLLTFFYFLWLHILWLTGIIFWTNYYLDVWIITSKKIIDVKQHGLFRREVSFLRLEKIQDVSCHIGGLLPTLLKYGDISVHSAGIQGEFLIKGVPDPSLLHSKINEALKINNDSTILADNNL